VIHHCCRRLFQRGSWRGPRSAEFWTRAQATQERNITIWALLWITAIVVGVRVAWWAFRVLFWVAILFIAEAGKAWRGEY
jgi:hypothetical protein